MKKMLRFEGTVISYEIKHHSRAKHFRVSVFSDARVLVTIPRHASIRAGEKFLKKKVSWVQKKLAEFEHGSMPSQEKGRDEYLKHKELAREFIVKKVRELNEHYDLPYKKISVRDQKTRWGSCSSNGNLSFHYRLLFLPKEQAEYVIVHELCHLKEMNHSTRFWKLVAEVVPEYREMRRMLRKQWH